jgi:hypothetical protein
LTAPGELVAAAPRDAGARSSPLRRSAGASLPRRALGTPCRRHCVARRVRHRRTARRARRVDADALLGEFVVVAPCAGVSARRGRRAAAPLAEVTTPSRNASPGKLVAGL